MHFSTARARLSSPLHNSVCSYYSTIAGRIEYFPLAIAWICLEEHKERKRGRKKERKKRKISFIRIVVARFLATIFCCTFFISFTIFEKKRRHNAWSCNDAPNNVIEGEFYLINLCWLYTVHS
jgi:hypothetical protein